MHQSVIESASSLDRSVSGIYSALSELNLQLPRGMRVENSLNTVLFGAGSVLDSLALANLIVILEAKLETAFGFQIDLTQDDPFSPETGHFQTVQSLVDYVSGLVQLRSKGWNLPTCLARNLPSLSASTVFKGNTATGEPMDEMTEQDLRGWVLSRGFSELQTRRMIEHTDDAQSITITLP
jgi:acyl carrier protein